jgi:hypothetical protein
MTGFARVFIHSHGLWMVKKPSDTMIWYIYTPIPVYFHNFWPKNAGISNPIIQPSECQESVGFDALRAVLLLLGLVPAEFSWVVSQPIHMSHGQYSRKMVDGHPIHNKDPELMVIINPEWNHWMTSPYYWLLTMSIDHSSYGCFIARRWSLIYPLVNVYSLRFCYWTWPYKSSIYH